MANLNAIARLAKSPSPADLGNVLAELGLNDKASSRDVLREFRALEAGKLSALKEGQVDWASDPETVTGFDKLKDMLCVRQFLAQKVLPLVDTEIKDPTKYVQKLRDTVLQGKAAEGLRLACPEDPGEFLSKFSRHCEDYWALPAAPPGGGAVPAVPLAAKFKEAAEKLAFLAQMYPEYEKTRGRSLRASENLTQTKESLEELEALGPELVKEREKQAEDHKTTLDELDRLLAGETSHALAQYKQLPMGDPNSKIVLQKVGGDIAGLQSKAAERRADAQRRLDEAKTVVEEKERAFLEAGAKLDSAKVRERQLRTVASAAIGAYVGFGMFASRITDWYISNPDGFAKFFQHLTNPPWIGIGASGLLAGVAVFSFVRSLPRVYNRLNRSRPYLGIVLQLPCDLSRINEEGKRRGILGILGALFQRETWRSPIYRVKSMVAGREAAKTEVGDAKNMVEARQQDIAVHGTASGKLDDARQRLAELEKRLDAHDKLTKERQGVEEKIKQLKASRRKLRSEAGAMKIAVKSKLYVIQNRWNGFTHGMPV